MNSVAFIVGVGPGLGAALARRFACGGFRVALVARSPGFIGGLARELCSLGQPALAIVADASRSAEMAAVAAKARAELGTIGVLVHNASSSSGNGLLETSAAQSEATWRIAVLGDFRLRARRRARHDRSRNVRNDFHRRDLEGARRRLARVQQREVCTAPSWRNLSPHELWPQGIHVAHVIVDGLIGSQDAAQNESASRCSIPIEWLTFTSDDRQDRSAWTVELDMRPHHEKFFE